MATRTTTHGLVEGVERLGVEQYRGIRYGEPPVGERRFQSPVPARQWREGWDGTLDATAFANRAMQPPMSAVFGGAGPGTNDEDCLFLNVFTPAGDGELRPVLCWIHGGSYTTGSANDYNASIIAAQGDVVVVAVNYRLGAFGFLDVSGLDASLAGSAANGIRDQILALEWIRDNVAAFGGDPDNVTIIGESAGAGSVLGIMASPSADGLYHRAVANSPGGINLPPNPAWAERIADRLGGDRVGSVLDRLRSASADELLDAQIAVEFPAGSIDGVVVTQHPVDAIRARGSVPLVVGTNLDEGTLLTLQWRDQPELLDAITRSIAVQVTRNGDVDAYLDEVRARYPGDDAYARANQVWCDLFRRTAVDAAAAATEFGSGGWLYRLDLPTTAAGDALGATHSADVALTFNWLGAERPMGFSLYDRDDPTAVDLAQRWSDTIIAFARTGDPNDAGLPAWPRYSTDGRACLVLDTTIELRDDPDGADRDRWR
ncbi:MAG TPA: carboxylesterase family protein [Ilumatobacteraceae bacterium]|nr:carboxylesterase family protein [Ilumatobacteraceae bacterium]